MLYTPVDVSSIPVFQSIKYSKTSVKSGDNVTIYANFTDTSLLTTGIVDMYTGNYHFTTVNLNYNATSKLLEGVLTITQYFPANLSAGDIIAYDQGGQFTQVYNGTDYIDQGITISGTTPDLIPPTLNSVTFNSTTAIPNQVIQIDLNINDSLSGVNPIDCSVQLYYKGNNFVTYSLFASVTPDMYYAQFTVGQYWPSSAYIGGIYLADNNGNSEHLLNNTDFVAPVLTITGSSYDVTPPTLHGNPTFSTNFAFYNVPTYVYVNMTDDISGVQAVSVSLADQVSSYFIDSLQLNYSSSLKLWMGKFTPNPSTYVNPFYVSQIYSDDNAANFITYTNGSDFISPNIPVAYAIPNTIRLNLSPNNGTSDAGHKNAYSVSIYSGFNHDMINTHVNLQANGSILTTANVNLLPSYGYYTLNLYVTFNKTGSYQGQLVFFDDLNVQWTIPFNWTVVPPTNPGIISLVISPNNENSTRGQRVSFTATLSSSFYYDMNSISLSFAGRYNAGPINIFYASITTLPAKSVKTVTFSVLFNQTGQIEGKLTVYDDNNVAWSTPFSWTVLKATSPPSNPTPSIPTPGFTFTVSLVSLIGLITIYREKRYLKLKYNK